VAVLTGDGVGAIVVVDARGPRYQRMRVQAQSLRVEAGQRRVKQAHAAGSIDATSLAELLALAFSDPMRIGPSVDEIVAWHSDAVAKERARRQRLELEDAPITQLHLEWRVGVIEKSASFASSATSTTNALSIDSEAEFAAAAATEQSA